MAQITLYLDEDTMRKVRKQAREAGVSQSRRVADLIRKGGSVEWPSTIARLAGAWPDAPLAEEMRADATDVERERL